MTCRLDQEAGQAPDQPFQRPGVAARAAIEALHTLKRIFGSTKSVDEKQLYKMLRKGFAANRGSAREVGWFYTIERTGVPVDWYDRNRPPGAESIQSYRRRFYSQMAVYRSWSQEALSKCAQ